MCVRYRVKHAFTVFLISSVALLIFPSAFTIYLQSQVYKYSADHCVATTLSDIRKSGAALAEQLESMDSAAMAFMFDMDMMNMMHMHKPDYGDPKVYQIVEFSKRLDEKLSGVTRSSLGYRVFMRDNEFVFYNGAMTHGLAFSYKKLFYYANMNYDEWYAAAFGQQKRRLLPMDEITFNNGYKQYAVTYSYAITRRSSGNANKMAAIQFFITKQQIAELFLDLPEQGCGYLLDGSGAEIARTGNIHLPAVNASHMEGASGHYYADGGDVIIIYEKVASDIALAAALPTSVAFEDADRVRKASYLALACYALIESAVCVYLARKNATPIKRFARDMSTLINEQGAPGSRTSEYAYLEKGITHMIQTKQAESHARSETRRLEQVLFIDRLLGDEYKGEEAILEKAQALKLELRARYVCAAVCFTSRALEAEAPAAGALRVLTHPYRGASTAVIFLSDADSMNAAREQALEYLSALIKYADARPRAGLGKVYESIEDLPLSAQQALYCAQAEGLADGVHVFDIVSRTFNAPHFTIRQQQRLANATKHHDAAVIEEVFDSILTENTQDRHLSSALKGVLLANVESTLLSVAEEMITDHNLSDLLHAVRRSGDFRERLSALKQAFIDISRAGDEKPAGEALRSRLEQYMRDHCHDSDLCVTSAAASFGLSESHFSMTFKDLLGEPFSAYLENMRLQKAIALMRETDQSLEAIARQVGYNNSTTFRRAFKRAMGISPQKFRDDMEA